MNNKRRKKKRKTNALNTYKPTKEELRKVRDYLNEQAKNKSKL